MTERVLEASFSKIERARVLLIDLTREIESYEQGLKTTIVKEHVGGDLVHIVLKTSEPVPKSTNILAAEIIYHLRSALDQMVSEIGRQNGVNDTRRIMFPFCGSRAKFSEKGTARKIQDLPTDVQNMLRNLEPFKDGNIRLWGMGALANVDKHEMLIPIGAVGVVNAVQGMVVDGANHPESVAFNIQEPANLLEGIILSKIGSKGSFKVKDLGTAIYVGFGDVPVFSKETTTTTLTELVTLCEGIVQSFSNHCFKE